MQNRHSNTTKEWSCGRRTICFIIKRCYFRNLLYAWMMRKIVIKQLYFPRHCNDCGETYAVKTDCLAICEINKTGRSMIVGKLSQSVAFKLFQLSTKSTYRGLRAKVCLVLYISISVNTVSLKVLNMLRFF